MIEEAELEQASSLEAVSQEQSSLSPVIFFFFFLFYNDVCLFWCVCVFSKVCTGATRSPVYIKLSLLPYSRLKHRKELGDT